MKLLLKIACKYLISTSVFLKYAPLSFILPSLLTLLCVSLAESPPAAEPPSKRVKIEETFQLSEQQQQLIREDTANKKLWDEAMGNLKEGPV